jgi:hypothetical protein
MREGVRIRLIHFGVALLAGLTAAISPAATSSLTIGLPANNGASIQAEIIGGYACSPSAVQLPSSRVAEEQAC